MNGKYFLVLKGQTHEICQSKAQYAQSLCNLEDISESIHERQVFFYIKETGSWDRPVQGPVRPVISRVHPWTVSIFLLKEQAHKICQSKAQYAQSSQSPSMNGKYFFIKGTSS